MTQPRTHLPLGLIPAVLSAVLFALSLLGAWNASRQTQYPPAHDVLSYTTKAENDWAELREGKFSGLMRTEPTLRPFGTSLLGYPFGYSEDFRAFYWRTVAFPACFAAIGALFAALAAGVSWRSPVAWLVACLAGMLPMWWTFDRAGDVDVSWWGMMDGMQAGVAAMATGLLLLGWRRNSRVITSAAFALSAFTLLIKPVGVFLIAGQFLAAGCLWLWSFKNAGAESWRRFAGGVLSGLVFCSVVGAACYFSPYFSESNRELGRQALDQLKVMKEVGGILLTASKRLPFPIISGLGWVTLALWTAALFRSPRALQGRSWLIAVSAAAALVLVFELAALYHGTRFVLPRYFLPALVTFWIFTSPFLLFLLQESRLARLCVLFNAIILSASVWFPEFAREWHQKTRYATFLNSEAASTYELAKSALEKSAPFSREPIVYILPGRKAVAQGIVARQMTEVGKWEESSVWPYQPRVWEGHLPFVHPHELATSDFLLTAAGEAFTDKNGLLGDIQSFLATPLGNSLAPAVAEGNELAIRTIADPLEFERSVSRLLIAKGLVHPDQSGPMPADVDSAVLATWDSGDTLVSARAEWVDGKLRVTTTWSGTRTEKRHLKIKVDLIDSEGSHIQQITCSLLPPPSAADGKAYRRTFVEELDCRRFSGRTASVAIGIYDRPAKSNVPARTKDSPQATAWVALPISGGAP